VSASRGHAHAHAHARGGGKRIGDTAKRGSGDGSEAAHGADEHELVPEADADVIEELHLDTLGLLEQVLELRDAVTDAAEGACVDGRGWSGSESAMYQQRCL
jgi:hypothetical protein